MSTAARSFLVATICSATAWPQQPPASRSVSPADSLCAAAFDSLQSIFRNDYPGYREKIAGHDAQLAALSDSVGAVVRTSNAQSICIPALQRWTRFFHDPHIAGPWQS